MNELYEIMDRRDRLANRMALQHELMGVVSIEEGYELMIQHVRDMAERGALMREIQSRMESFRREGAKDLDDREIADNLDI